MPCPKCQYENKPDALVCNLCQHVLRRVGAPRVQPPRTSATPMPAQTFVEPPRQRTPFPWGVTILSALLLAWGLSLIVQRRRLVTFPEYPRNASPQQIVAEPGYAYVRFDRARLQRDAGFFAARRGRETSFSASDPRIGFTAATPGEILSRAKDHPKGFVQISKLPPLLEVYELTQKRIHYEGPLYARKTTSEELLGHRFYAPVLGTKGRLWLVSTWYAPNLKPSMETFAATTSFSGTLEPLTLEPDAMAQLKAKTHVPHDAIAIVAGATAPTHDSVSTWFPLGDSYDVFVEAPDDVDVDQVYSEGVADLPIASATERAALAAFLTKRLGHSVALPPRVRVVVLADPSEFTSLRVLPSKWHPVGIASACIGGVSLLLVALRRLNR